MPMTFKEGLAHLQARRVQMIPKTGYNRLRWTRGDLDAVEAILAGVAKAVRRAEERKPPETLNDEREFEQGYGDVPDRQAPERQARA